MIDQYGQEPKISYTTKKGVINNERWSRLLRQCVLQETLCAFASTFDTMTYHEIAHYNMIRFKEKSLWKEIDKSTFGIIKVINSDTLDAALSATKIFGETFTVLNMANATGFGGGYTHGRSAQEENIFRRTDCHFSMLREYLNGGTYTNYVYSDENGKKDKTMTQKIEQGIVFKDQPRVCIRRGESLVPDGNKSPVEIQQLIHYKWLDYYDIFQFYEMRNAARDYRDEDYNPFYKAKEGGVKDDNTTKYPISDTDAIILYNEAKKEIKAEADAAEKAKKQLVKAIVSDMKTRIINQLTQLIKNNCEYVILSAFGCGAFHNHPIVVSNLYNEIFESVYDKATPTKTYRDHFKVIIFAIYQNNPNVNNSAQFKLFLDNSEASNPNVKAFLDQLDPPAAVAAGPP